MQITRVFIIGCEYVTRLNWKRQLKHNVWGFFGFEAKTSLNFVWGYLIPNK